MSVLTSVPFVLRLFLFKLSMMANFFNTDGFYSHKMTSSLANQLLRSDGVMWKEMKKNKTKTNTRCIIPKDQLNQCRNVQLAALELFIFCFISFPGKIFLLK